MGKRTVDKRVKWLKDFLERLDRSCGCLDVVGKPTKKHSYYQAYRDAFAGLDIRDKYNNLLAAYLQLAKFADIVLELYQTDFEIFEYHYNGFGGVIQSFAEIVENQCHEFQK